MRTLVALLTGAVVALTALPASAAPSLDSLVVPGSVSLGANPALDVTGVATFDDPARAQVFTDGTLDDAALLEATPPAQDLVAGFVAVNREAATLDLTWGVLDLPDVGGVPEIIRYMWEFSLQAPGSDDETLFQAQAKYTNVVDRAGPQAAVPAGKVSGDCTTEGNLITCVKIGDANVTYDGAANEVTIHIPFALLKDADGNSLVVNGTRMRQAEIFRGIAAILQAVVSTAAMGDVASSSDMTFGNHVQIGLNLADTPEEFLDTSTHVIAAPDGSFAGSLSLEGLLPGDYKVAAKACVDAGCGPVTTVSTSLTP